VLCERLAEAIACVHDIRIAPPQRRQRRPIADDVLVPGVSRAEMPQSLFPATRPAYMRIGLLAQG
jgi:hypothetical protein